MSSRPEPAVGAPRRPWLLHLLGVAACLAAAGCRRGEQGVFIVAPFNDETKIATVHATWQPGPPVHFQVRVENRLGDRLFVRLGDFRLRGRGGESLGTSQASRACLIEAGATALVLEGDLPAAAGADVTSASFEVNRFGVPLSERGRGIYREFLLQSQKYTAAQVDAEFEAYQSSPPCG